MDLEKRVEALEKEVEILKAQIQSTLLDIQEHLLTHTYPALRAEHAAPSPTRTIPANPPAASQPQPPAPVPPEPAPDPGTVSVRKISLADLANDEPPQPAAPPPVVKKEPEQTPRPTPSRADNGATAGSEIDSSTLHRLEDWAAGKVDRVGAARTRAIIHNHADQGRFSAEVAARLLKFVNMYDTAEATQPPAPSKLSKNQRSRSTNQPSSKRKAASSPPTPPPAAPVAKPAHAPTQPPVDPEEEDEEASVVLRLIAGIQNAGAGVKWRNHKDG